MSHLVCVGLGYSAAALAEQISARGWRVTGTARTPDGAKRIQGLGYATTVFDGATPSPGVAEALRDATHLLVSAPPGDKADPLLSAHAETIASAPALRWIGYLSTVGVYGDRQGGWVDEDSPPAPVSGRSRQRLAAEQAWAGLARPDRRIEIFRIAGIYGPGRSAIDAVRAGTARRIVKPGQIFNRIHVADIANVVLAAIDGADPGGSIIYNLADDEPAPPQDVIAFAARLLGVAPPEEIPVDEAQLSSMARSFYVECKRVSNARIKARLGVRLLYPTYREGLRAIAAL